MKNGQNPSSAQRKFLESINEKSDVKIVKDYNFKNTRILEIIDGGKLRKISVNVK